MSVNSTTEGTVPVTVNIGTEVQDITYWAKRWEDKKTGWHLNNVNPNLIKNIEWLTNAEAGQPTSRKILVPLCGQSHDLLYLLGLGHQVFGIEAVPECIQGLNERDDLKLKFNEKETIYHTEDDKLKIYAGDIFECSIETYGPFDAIWDRGSLIAVEYVQRRAYVDLMRRSVTSDGKVQNFRYLLESVEYDKSLFGGPPRSVLESDMIELYSSWAKYEVVNKEQMPEKSGLRKAIPEGHDANMLIYRISKF